MSGGLGVTLTALGLWTPLPVPRLFVVAGFLSLIVAAFLTWREEHYKYEEQLKKNEAKPEDPQVLRLREDAFELQIDSLEDDLRNYLLWLVASGEAQIKPEFQAIAGRTHLLICEGDSCRIAPAFKPLLEKWAAGYYKPPEAGGPTTTKS